MWRSIGLTQCSQGKALWPSCHTATTNAPPSSELAGMARERPTVLLFTQAQGSLRWLQPRKAINSQLCGRPSHLSWAGRHPDPCHSRILQNLTLLPQFQPWGGFQNLHPPDYLALHSYSLQDNSPNFSQSGRGSFLRLWMVTSCPATRWPERQEIKKGQALSRDWRRGAEEKYL